MRKHSFFIMLIIGTWFVGTNHCAFGFCQPISNSTTTSTNNESPSSKDQIPQHNDCDQSHACGSPCRMVSYLHVSQNIETKVELVLNYFPSDFFKTLLSDLHYSYPLDHHILKSELNLSIHRPILLTILKEAPNAPPIMLL